MSNETLKKPDDNYPSLDDFRSGNVSDEWKQYFSDVLNMFSPWQQKLIAEWDNTKAEAHKLLDLLHSCGDMGKVEEYIRENPPTASLIIHLLIAHEIQSKSETASKGGDGKALRYQPLKNIAKNLVSEKKFKSRRSAAKTITPTIIAESKKLGVALSEDQAEITITGWLKEMGLPANI